MTTTTAPQRHEFKTELKQLLDLIIHSLYTKNEIFLRELISNAADAIDKVRFESLTNPDLLEGNSDWKIELLPDEAAGTLIIRDNGIGMSRETIVENLGTIARSGTRAFLEKLKEANAQNRPELIGQFGVGFYSSFMVADKVTVMSRTAGNADDGVRWESDGQGTYTLEPASKATRGTDIILHLREDAKEFLKEWRLREVVKRYSDFIEHPIILPVTREVDGKKTTENQTLNSRQAIWLRPKNQIKEEEYNEFYKQLTRDFEPPLKTIHVAAEGTMEFRAILYLPTKRPMEWMFAPPKPGIDLYVRRVLIEHQCEQLIPSYLRMVRGVVDSADLPLNVSRETLQHNPLLPKIRSNLVNRILKTLEEMRDGDYANYVKFHDEFGEVLKEGVGTDFSNRDRIADLLLFESTRTKPGEYTTLAKVVANMPSDQKEIYYLTGETRALLENSPYIESLKSQGREVLLLTDPVDEYVVQHLHQYKEKTLKPADKGELPADPEKDKQRKEAEEKFKGLTDKVRAKLQDQVKEVRFSARLTDSPACLVADEHAMGAHMERLLRKMGRGDDIPESKRILELNPTHPLIEAMQKLAGEGGNEQKLETYAHLLYDQALLAEGSTPKDLAAFTRRLNEVLIRDAG